MLRGRCRLHLNAAPLCSSVRLRSPCNFRREGKQTPKNDRELSPTIGQIPPPPLFRFFPSFLLLPSRGDRLPRVERLLLVDAEAAAKQEREREGRSPPSSLFSISDKNKVNGEWGCRKGSWLQQDRRGEREQGELLRENDASRVGPYQSERGKAKSTAIDATGHAVNTMKTPRSVSRRSRVRGSLKMKWKMTSGPLSYNARASFEERKPRKMRSVPKFAPEKEYFCTLDTLYFALGYSSCLACYLFPRSSFS